MRPQVEELSFIQRALRGLSPVLALSLLAPATALAHVQGGEASGFWSGLTHPMAGWDHVLAMVAVGIWGAQLGQPAIWVLPVTFPMVMAFGGMLGLMGLALPGVEVGIAISAVVLGIMILGEVKPPLWIAAAMVGLFAIFHGHAHGTELPAGSSGVYYSIGFVIATGTLHALGISIGLIHKWSAGRVLLRAAGVVVSVAGVLFLLQAVN